jgi:hypothetical protein
VTNIWIPDGYKDTPADRKAPASGCKESLDAVFAEPLDPRHNLDAVEAKLFGIGSESYVVGSHEFYLGYAVTRNQTAVPGRRPLPPHRDDRRQDLVVLLYVDELLLHVSRGVRWDSDHVVTLTDELQAIMQEIVRGDYLDRVHIGLDFFDASINRVAAWVIGTRNTESGRVMAVHFDGRTLAIVELHRFPNVPVRIGGTLYWDFLRLWNDIQAGLDRGRALRPASLGVDTWGVDFGLLDGQGRLIGNPVHYRDGRTAGMMELAVARLARDEIFAQTGIQFLPINTLYQMLSLVESASPQLQIAETFLTAPDLLNYWLTGAKVCEFSIATTTQMFNPITGSWAKPLLDQLGIPSHIFPEVVPPGTRLGQYDGIPVIAPACHDTGSAVAAMPAAAADFAYISSGTWSLVGLEIPAT